MGLDFAAYLKRVGLDGIALCADGLRALQEAQLRAIPFENFDPLLGEVPDLAPDAVFDKLVMRRRGGYCFELNTLFEGALKASGFSVRRVLARVRMRGDSEAPRSHLVLLVEADGQEFLADAGFGGPGSLHPLPLDVAAEQLTPSGTYRLTQDAGRGETVLERRGADGWVQLYAFDRARVSDGEIAAANYSCATWGEAPFASHVLAGGYDGDLRYGLFDRQVSITGPDGVEQRDLAEFGQFAEFVTGRLGIALDRVSLERAWAKSGA